MAGCFGEICQGVHLIGQLQLISPFPPTFRFGSPGGTLTPSDDAVLSVAPTAVGVVVLSPGTTYWKDTQCPG